MPDWIPSTRKPAKNAAVSSAACGVKPANPIEPTTGQAMNAPFGGLKNSSTQTSKEQAGESMMAFYTVDKTVYLSA